MISLLEIQNRKPMSFKKKIGIGIGVGLAAGAGYTAYKNKDKLKDMATNASNTIKKHLSNKTETGGANIKDKTIQTSELTRRSMGYDPANRLTSVRNLHKTVTKRIASEDHLARLNFAKGGSSGPSHNNINAIKRVPSRDALQRHAAGKVPSTTAVGWDEVK